ncbi:MAG: hypothetical protein JXX29_17775 [Deltaproteobacteria bacterium]|nr:hypothetical protein [Deltaproteobacteria bacterium]
MTAGTIKKNWDIIVIAVIVLLTLSQTLKNELIWDDIFIIKNNPNIGDSHKLFEVVSVPFWENSSYTEKPLTNFWRPFTSLSIWLVGLITSQAWIFHLLSMIASLAAAFTFGLFIQSTSEKHIPLRTIFYLSSVYAIHPLTVETTCLVSNISDHLALTFLFLTCYYTSLYINSTQHTRILVILFLTAFLAAASKEFGLLSVAIPLGYSLIYKGTNKTKSQKYSKILLPSGIVLLSATIFLIVRYFVVSVSEFTVGRDVAYLTLSQFIVGYGAAFKHIFFLSPAGTMLQISSPIPYIVFGVVCVISFSLLLVLFLNKSPYLKTLLFAFLLGLLLLGPSFITVQLNAFNNYEYPTRYFHILLFGILPFTIPATIKFSNSKFTGWIVVSIISLLAIISFIRIEQWRTPLTLYAEEYRLNPQSERNVLYFSEELVAHNAFTDAERSISTFQMKHSFRTPYYIARKHSLLSQIYFLRDGNLKKAIQEGKTALKTYPYAPILVTRMARVISASGNQQIALKLLRDALNDKNFSSAQKYRFHEEIQFLNRLNHPDQPKGINE